MSVPYDYRTPIIILQRMMLIDPFVSQNECPYILAREYLDSLTEEQRQEIFKL